MKPQFKELINFFTDHEVMKGEKLDPNADFQKFFERFLHFQYLLSATSANEVNTLIASAPKNTSMTNLFFKKSTYADKLKGISASDWIQERGEILADPNYQNLLVKMRARYTENAEFSRAAIEGLDAYVRDVRIDSSLPEKSSELSSILCFDDASDAKTIQKIASNQTLNFLWSEYFLSPKEIQAVLVQMNDASYAPFFKAMGEFLTDTSENGKSKKIKESDYLILLETYLSKADPQSREDFNSRLKTFFAQREKDGDKKVQGYINLIAKQPENFPLAKQCFQDTLGKEIKLVESLAVDEPNKIRGKRSFSSK